MSAPSWLSDEITRRQMTAVGLGLIGGAAVLGGLVYLVQRQVRQGDVLQVRVTHDVEPKTKELLAALRPTFEQAVNEGVGVNVRLFPRHLTG